MKSYPYVVTFSSAQGDDLVDWVEIHAMPSDGFSPTRAFPLSIPVKDWMRVNIEGAWRGLFEVWIDGRSLVNEMRFELEDDSALFAMRWL